MALNFRIADWRGRTVWLVGASTGIGRATASALHAQGAKVVVSARNADALRAFADGHAGALALPLDVTDTPALKAMASALAARGALDCVLYCAGHYHAMDALHMDLGDMVRHNEVNYLGALRVLDAVLPHLLAQPPDERTGQRGHISLIGSVAGYRGLPNSLAYGPTKAALINLAETLYLDLHGQRRGRLPHQPRLCRHTADATEPVQNARLDHPRTGGARNTEGLGTRRV
jgi:NAD(P)-dependent dehydrogenase (short-subunit alcohol dehydrogenase family)